MNTKIELQDSYIDFIKKNCIRPQYAVTFTFKSSVFIEDRNSVTYEKPDILKTLERRMPEYKWDNRKRIGHTAYLNEEIANSTMDYFYTNLTYMTYGKDSRKPSKMNFSKPLLLTTNEGNAGKLIRTHKHGIIGNLPDSVRGIDEIYYAWGKTDFGGSLVVKPIYDIDGWFSYITKQIRTGNDTTVEIDRIRKPNTYL